MRWEDGSEKPTSQSRIVDPSRLPRPITHLTPTDSWCDEWTFAMWDHIWVGQRGTLPRQLQFEFRPQIADLCLNGRQDLIENENTFRVTPAGRYWVARMVKADPKDDLIFQQLVAQLPSMDSVLPVYQPFSEATQIALKEACKNHKKFSRLIDSVTQLEQLRPIHVSASIVN